MKIIKLIKAANVRKRMDAHYRGEISYSRAVELLNEDANKALNKDGIRFSFDELKEKLLRHQAKSEYKQASIVILRNIFEEYET